MYHHKMMQPEQVQSISPWPFHEVMDSIPDQSMSHDPHMGYYIGVPEFSSSLSNTEDSYESLSPTNFHAMFPSELDGLHGFGESLGVASPVASVQMDIDKFELIPSSEIGGWSASPSPSPSLDLSSYPPALILPLEGTEMDNKVSLYHLLDAFGEAQENGQNELIDVLSRCIRERVNPLGDATDRLASYMFQRKEEISYVKQESLKNLRPALNAFYGLSPHARFAHFAANLSILESMPEGIETIHIVDFDMGEAIQWPPLMESIARRCVANLRLSSIKWDEEEEESWIEFDETKRELQENAKALGVGLLVEEMKFEELVSEVKKYSKRGCNGGSGRRSQPQLMVFNCMVGLPHMVRRRSETAVGEFLGVAKELIDNNLVKRGLITFGEGETSDKPGTFGAFFKNNVEYYHRVLESMESDFPIQLAEARIAVESLFVAPFVSPHGWFRKWEEKSSNGKLSRGQPCLVGGKIISGECLMEAQELIKGKTSYSVSIGENQNEMVLEWKEAALVRFLVWGN